MINSTVTQIDPAAISLPPTHSVDITDFIPTPSLGTREATPS